MEDPCAKLCGQCEQQVWNVVKQQIMVNQVKAVSFYEKFCFYSFCLVNQNVRGILLADLVYLFLKNSSFWDTMIMVSFVISLNYETRKRKMQ